MRKFKVIKNEKIGIDLNVYGTIEKPLFLANDIAFLLKNKRARDIVSRISGGNKFKLPFKKISSQGVRNQWFVNKDGISEICTKSRNGSIIIKEFLLKSADVEDVTIVRSFPETEFLDSVETIVSILGYTLERQKTIGRYKLDGYIPELNINIEYDELQHMYNRSLDKKRQEYIVSKINCSVVRCDIKNHKDYNVGLVVKCIINKQLK